MHVGFLHVHESVQACTTYVRRIAPLRRSISSRRLAQLLSKRFHADEGRWNTKDTAREIKTLDEGAVGLAAAVLEHLKGLKSLTNALQCELAQGYAECLRRRGFGVALHITDAASVREQILELARKRFEAVKRKSGLKKARFKPSSLASLLSKVKDYASDSDSDDGTADESVNADTPARKRRKRSKVESPEAPSASKVEQTLKRKQAYLVGFTIVPNNVMGDRLRDFGPTRSFDMCGKRKRASGVRLSDTHPYSGCRYFGSAANVLECEFLECNVLRYEFVECNVLRYDFVECNVRRYEFGECNVLRYEFGECNVLRYEFGECNVLR